MLLAELLMEYALGVNLSRINRCLHRSYTLGPRVNNVTVYCGCFCFGKSFEDPCVTTLWLQRE